MANQSFNNVHKATNGFYLGGHWSMSKHLANGKVSKLLLALITIILVNIFLLGFWLHEKNATPNITIPTPRMPNPNARDWYLKASNSFVPYQVATATGHYSLTFSRVEQLLGRSETLGTGAGIAAYRARIHADSIDPEPSLAELQGLIRVNAPAFAYLREGFHYEFRETPIRSWNAIYPQWSKYRSMANFLQLDAIVKRMKGNWNGAAQDAIDTIHYGEDIPHGTILLGKLVGIALQTIGRDEVWETINHLSASQARKASRRLEESNRNHVSVAESLQEEEWMGQAGLIEIFRKPNWRQELVRICEVGKGNQQVGQLLTYTVSQRQIFDDYTRYVNIEIALAHGPYMSTQTDPPLPNDHFTTALVPSYAYPRFVDAFSETQNHLLLVSFALRAYFLEHGHYPNDLSALVPDYLQAIPADPFTAGKALCYQRTGNIYTLYSVGPDGKDNHGTPCIGGRAHSKTQKPLSTIYKTIVGDIVAGVNVQARF